MKEIGASSHIMISQSPKKIQSQKREITSFLFSWQLSSMGI